MTRLPQLGTMVAMKRLYTRKFIVAIRQQDWLIPHVVTSQAPEMLVVLTLISEQRML